METAFDYAYVDAEIAGTSYTEFVVTTRTRTSRLTKHCGSRSSSHTRNQKSRMCSPSLSQSGRIMLSRRLSDTASLIRDVVEAYDQP